MYKLMRSFNRLARVDGITKAFPEKTGLAKATGES
jgi:hypothetical protein